MASDKGALRSSSLRDEQREAVLKSLSVKVRKGALAAALEEQARLDSERLAKSRTTNPSIVALFQNSTVPLALAKLSTLTTGTLEYMDAQITEPSLDHDRIHTFFTSFKKWEKDTKGHADIMVRDLIHLRHEEVTASSLIANAMFEMYARSGITKGRMHTEEDLGKAGLALSFFRIAKQSRHVEVESIDRSPTFQKLHPHDQVVVREKREQRAVQRTHLTDAVVEYVVAAPRNAKCLLDYITEFQKPAHRVNLGHLAEYTKAQPSIRKGAL